MKSLITDERGLSVIGIIILLAFLYAGLSLYAYFNPSFELAKYTPISFLSNYRDEERKEELAKVAVALDSYYDENRDLPGNKGFCGRIVTVLHPAAKDALSPYFPDGIPQDPVHGGSDKDYFYLKEGRNTYVLLAVLDNPLTSETYNYEKCHDWPGDNIYNYMVTNG